MPVVFVTIAPLGTAMGSIIEGNLDEILPVLREMHKKLFGQDAAS
jgi:uncharacterized protein YqgV (UPF0045/DUF77 family)